MTYNYTEQLTLVQKIDYIAKIVIQDKRAIYNVIEPPDYLFNHK